MVHLGRSSDIFAEELVQTSIVQRDPEPWKTWIPYAALLLGLKCNGKDQPFRLSDFNKTTSFWNVNTEMKIHEKAEGMILVQL